MSKNNRFEVVYQETGLKSEKTIYVDKETGVNYFFYCKWIWRWFSTTIRCGGKTYYYKINHNIKN